MSTATMTYAPLVAVDEWLVRWRDSTGSEEDEDDVLKANVQQFVLELRARGAVDIRVYRPVPFKLVTTAEVLDG